MALDPQQLRIEGIYQQKEPGRYMMRVKLAGGVISAEQAQMVAFLAGRHASGSIHLTTRCSMELHRIKEEELREVSRQLTAVGLTSRGACGGAVRGVSCSTTAAPGYPVVQVLARKLQQHFTQNPHFEGLPKKFKIGVEAGYEGSRHLIQDVGLVLAGGDQGRDLFDVWIAGGLGREPKAGLLLASRVGEDELIPLIEDIIRLYRQHAPAGRRLKHLLLEMGEEGFRALLAGNRSPGLSAPIRDGYDKALTHSPAAPPPIRLEAAVFAGELPAETLRRLAEIARDHGGGYLVATSDQNVAFFIAQEELPAARTSLAQAGFAGDSVEEGVIFRICPGSHDCRIGLVPTRDMARAILAAMPAAARGLDWAISGCPNSCAQPQLADVGIAAVKLARGAEGEQVPSFTLWRREGADGLGTAVLQQISMEELMEAVAEIS